MSCVLPTLCGIVEIGFFSDMEPWNSLFNRNVFFFVLVRPFSLNNMQLLPALTTDYHPNLSTLKVSNKLP
jgi:hypothetical protein